ncbi:MAG: GIY-YIG nuclease family protein [Parcubacteria group bacterium]|nr:GIY-YIG nuclease family protein [Parcubacteria group bacterium]
MPTTGIKILLPDGDPNGIKVIEISGWKGKTFVIPRGKLKDIKEREEAEHPAIYFLFGEGSDPSRQKVYIGESETFYNRLLNHSDNKDFWNTAIVFTGGVNRAHIKYLENKSVALAKKINRYEVNNQVEPLENRLSEFEKAEADDYFEKVKLILGVSGFALFQEVPKRQDISEIYRFHVGGPNLRKKLETEGVLQRQNEDSFVFTKDYIFRSPSAAADTVAGRSSNGWTAWKDVVGKTLDENKRK